MSVSIGWSCSRRYSAGWSRWPGRRRVLLIIEDVHWADQASRDLLGFLFARLGVTDDLAVVVSFRTDDLHRRHPLRDTLAGWSRMGSVIRMSLDPLAPDDVRTLVGVLSARAVDETNLRSIVDRADGNAFFVEELVSATEQCPDAQQLPWHLADLMLVRLDRLSPDAREVVRVAAVAGRTVSHDLLEDVVELAPAELRQALREAVDAHVLEPRADGYAFRHALLAEAVYDDLLPGERTRIHAAYAAVLAKRDGGSASELARHAHASHDLATAYEASVRAGDEALAMAAPQEAMQHYEDALALAPHAQSARTTRRAWSVRRSRRRYRPATSHARSSWPGRRWRSCPRMRPHRRAPSCCTRRRWPPPRERSIRRPSLRPRRRSASSRTSR